ncbi:MAG: hypothetical protein P8L37_05260, partial [Phycisphaerales bacterium]|nr:hypothetical protein [Phycisphaerales bacterium]
IQQIAMAHTALTRMVIAVLPAHRPSTTHIAKARKPAAAAALAGSRFQLKSCIRPLSTDFCMN